YPHMIDLLNPYHPYDLSRVIIDLDNDSRLKIIAVLPDAFLGEIFEHLTVNEIKLFIDDIAIERLAHIFTSMDLDLSVDLIRGLKKTGIKILNHINFKRKNRILEMIHYQADEIGSYLNDGFLSIDINLTVKEAMRFVTEHAHEIDHISIVYVTSHQALIGYIRLKDLITARANELLKDIIETRFPKIYLDDDVEYVSRIMQETRESSIPIIDEGDHLLGVVTHDDIMDIVALEEEEDYTKFAGLSELDHDQNPYSLKQSIRSRLPWLMILLVLSMVTSLILSVFDARLSLSAPGAKLASQLAVFLPLILGMAGNTGTQSLAVTIRYLSKNENIETHILKTMIYRELKTGLAQGVLIGIIVFGMILLNRYAGQDQLFKLDYIYALVTSVSIFIALFISTTLGALIPMFMYRIDRDPAVASGPFITTISDIITLSIYYAIGMSILLPYYL
ncbi:MAG TPA: magnesium transporter, partial [Candidatus Izemoplasmatales bacterium]|nr:magnesium transporter [Candidatus Izemoplasmatales bacterium]